MASKALAPGVRFHPTDVELVKYYLQKKVSGKRIRFDVISEVDVYKFSPSDLPDKSQLKSMDLEWYFFCPRERKYVNGAKMNRATEFGYWKTTGRDRVIEFNDKNVGMIKTLIYHEGRAPKGNRTDWVMHEYRLKDDDLAKSGINQDAYVICKIFLKSGPGPRPSQYLFKEDDWSDDNDDTSVNTYLTASLTASSFPVALNMNNPCCSTVTNPGIPDGISTEASPIESISVLKEGDSKSISRLGLPNTLKEHPSTMALQKDASISELPQFINSHISGNQNEYSMRREKGMHGNSCASYDGLSHTATFLTWEMPGESNCMIPSRSVGAMVGLLDDINDSGAVQSAGLDCDDPCKLLDNFYVEGVQSEYEETVIKFDDHSANHPGNVQSTPLGWADLYKDLDNFYATGRQSGCEESFIELNDLITPLDDELHWSHLIPSDDLLNAANQHGSEVPPLSVDDYGSSSYSIALTESQSLPQSSLVFIGSLECTDAPQKDNADETGNSMLCCIENWKQWES